jgi:hypothetical protein
MLLHINGGYVFNPYPDMKQWQTFNEPEKRVKALLADIPHFVSARRIRSKSLISPDDDHEPKGRWPQECLYDRGAAAMRPQDINAIKRRIFSAMNIALLQLRERNSSPRPKLVP